MITITTGLPEPVRTGKTPPLLETQQWSHKRGKQSHVTLSVAVATGEQPKKKGGGNNNRVSLLCKAEIRTARRMHECRYLSGESAFEGECTLSSSLSFSGASNNGVNNASAA
ncbi:hypothetical protein L345_15159, partial [Ophiophagus hannah]